MDILPFKKTIHLINNGDLEFFFIGTGSAFSKKNYQTNLIIIKGDDHLLVDCGTTASIALTEYNFNISKIKNVFITHSHADHIGGLEEIMLKGRYVTNRKTKIYITKEYKHILWDQSLRGGCSYGEFADGGYMKFEDYFDEVSLDFVSNTPRPLFHTKIGTIDLKVFRTKHIPDSAGSWKNSFYSTGILVDNRILFPSDTRFDKELIDWMISEYPVEYIFHDCQFYPGGVHSFYGDLKTLPDNIRSKMFLCHYGDNFTDFEPEKDGFAGFAQRKQYYNFGK